MAKHQKQVIVNYVTLAEILVREYKITEGFWHVALTFGQVAGINAEMNLGKSGTRTIPSAIVPVMGISLLQSDVETDLTVDASVVNPASRILTANNPRSPFFN